MVTCDGGGGGGGLTQPYSYMLHWMDGWMDMHGEKKIEKNICMHDLAAEICEEWKGICNVFAASEAVRVGVWLRHQFFFPFFLFFFHFPVGAASCDSDSGRFTCALLILSIRRRSHHQAFFCARALEGCEG